MSLMTRERRDEVAGMLGDEQDACCGSGGAVSYGGGDGGVVRNVRRPRRFRRVRTC